MTDEASRCAAAALSVGEWYYGPVELKKVQEVLEQAEKAGAVRFQPSSREPASSARPRTQM